MPSSTAGYRRTGPVASSLTRFDSDDHVLRALRAGASGFLLKHTPPAELGGNGLTNGEIAHELRLSVATVKAYVSRVLAKLDLDNRVQLALLVHDAEPD